MDLPRSNTPTRWVLILFGVLIPLAARQSSQAQTFTVLHYFTETGGDGAFPQGSLVVGSAGNI